MRGVGPSLSQAPQSIAVLDSCQGRGRAPRLKLSKPFQSCNVWHAFQLGRQAHLLTGYQSGKGQVVDLYWADRGSGFAYSPKRPQAVR